MTFAPCRITSLELGDPLTEVNIVWAMVGSQDRRKKVFLVEKGTSFK